MNWLISTLEGAGFSKLSPTKLLLALTGAAFLVALAVFEATKVMPLSICLFVGTFGFALEALSLRARSRRAELAGLWPEVIDSLQSAASSGISITDAFADLALRGPRQLQPVAVAFLRQVESGESIDTALEIMKHDLGEIHADRLIELIRVVHEAGGQGYLGSLKRQGQQLRAQLNLQGMLESKQGWVSGTAKLAVAAPWLIVALLSSRPENAAAYNEPAGAGVLLIGFLVSLFAYRLIHMFGGLPEMPRVFQ